MPDGQEEKPEAKGEVEGMSAISLSCIKCGKPREDWTENEGQGVDRGGLPYCSEECANAPEEVEKEEATIKDNPGSR
jgi:hypothetical protein